MINELLGGVTHWLFLLSELHSQMCKSLGFPSETASCRTSTNLTVDGYSAQAQAFECLNGTHILLLFSLVSSLTAKGSYLNEASSGFEPETGPFQELNLQGL